MKKKKLLEANTLITVLTCALLLVSCQNQRSVSENQVREENSAIQESDVEAGEILGDHKYPQEPAEHLRVALKEDIRDRGLLMEIGTVEKVKFDDKECSQIQIHFTESDNMCVLSFTDKYLECSYDDYLLDGKTNPSFTIAFKDPNNTKDLIAVLTSIIKYLSPILSLEEAELQAKRQNETMSTDGYSQPYDLGGYQIQTRYTNPHVFFRTKDFDAKLGVKVTALEQIWGMIDTSTCQELKNDEDYKVLTDKYCYYNESEQLETVYGNFIVQNVWHFQSYLHGETWKNIDVKSVVTGERYLLSVDIMSPYVYEFGVGQEYTLFISTLWDGRIVNAVQRSESSQLNSRGEIASLEYPTLDEKSPRMRVEPDTDAPVYSVCFNFQDRIIGELFAAAEGVGLGEEQFLLDPGRDDYEFEGWYDNMTWEGDTYSKDTPIYEDTCLYAKWKYTGSGGAWPRAYCGKVQGGDEKKHVKINDTLTITSEGYGMELNAPLDQRFRWTPVRWRLSDGTSGDFTAMAPFQATLYVRNTGKKTLYITYMEEIFDGIDWQETRQKHEVPEVNFQVK